VLSSHSTLFVATRITAVHFQFSSLKFGGNNAAKVSETYRKECVNEN
jgi:hypothetical protein